MKLVSASASPFVRKVRVLLHETGQTQDVELLNVKTSPVAT
ncbi:MAG: glutathione S-transferase, partial [Rhodobacteraceae bacterium]|nr:glutathione S-transferase [Paracoccaceae bacterium]